MYEIIRFSATKSWDQLHVRHLRQLIVAIRNECIICADLWPRVESVLFM